MIEGIVIATVAQTLLSLWRIGLIVLIVVAIARSAR